MFAWLANFGFRHPWRILIGVVLFMAIAGPIGGPVASLLQPAGFTDPSSQSTKAQERITRALGGDPTQTLMVLIRTGVNVRTSSKARQDVRTVVRLLSRDSSIGHTLSYFDTHDPGMVSKDGKSTYVLAQFKQASDISISAAADRLDKKLSAYPNVVVGGGAVVSNQLGSIITRDLVRAELISFPLLFVLLLIVFRGVVAAFLPLLLGGIAILGTFLFVRLVNTTVPLSVFALDLINGLGLGLAIDYSLLILSRYREELALVGPGREAIARTVNTAGRTVFFSSITVMAALASLLVFPQRFLYSMGVGGVLVTFVDAAAALLVLPALLSVLGPRINALAPKRWQQTNEKSDSVGAWYALSKFVMRRAIIVAPLAALALLALGSPFLRIHLTSADASVLPTSASSRQVVDIIARDFPPSPTGHTFIAVAAPPSSATAVTTFANQVRRLPAARIVAPPRYLGKNTWEIDVLPRGADLSDKSQTFISSIRKLHPPVSYEVGGPSAQFVDYKASIFSHLPLVLGIMALALFIVLFLVTASIILPIKSFIMNLLTVSATFGALVLIFQDGRLENVLRYTTDNAIESSQPVLIFVLAFALSTDYGVFLLARIREARLLGADNETAVASGIQHTGRIVTAAAILFCVAMGAFATSQIVFIKELGIGTALSVLIDASLVRALLVPSLMRLLGNANWWAPRPLQWVAEHVKIEESALPAGEPAPLAHAPQPIPEPAPSAPPPAAAQPAPSVPPPAAVQAPPPIPALSTPSIASRQPSPGAQPRFVQAPPHLANFVVEVGPRSGARLPLAPGTTIGRDPRQSDVVLPDPLVSGRHAQVGEEDGQLVLYDAGSRNGIYVRGEAVKRHVLHSGDLIGMGQTIVRYIAPETEEPRSAARSAAPLSV